MSNSSNVVEMIAEARNEIYSYSSNDLTCQLAKEVMTIGLAKIKYLYRSLGEDQNEPIVIFGPDGGVTRNKERFDEGVGYGCIVATKKFIFPSLLHPNGCGYGLYKIHELPTLEEMFGRLKRLRTKGVPIEDKKGIWDVMKSNHFIDILTLDESSTQNSPFDNWLTPGYYVLIHSSQQTEKMKLSYWRQEEFTSVDSPLGKVQGLPKEKAQEYLEFFLEMEKYSQNKRDSIAKEVFGENNIEVIANPTHQGYYKEREYFIMRLGLSDSTVKSGEKKLNLFPMGFNGYSYIYLYQGLPNVKEEHWSINQLERAQRLGHKNFLRKANIIPHGGGYKLNYPYASAKIINIGNEIYFQLYDAPMKSKLIIQDIQSLEYGYRGPGEVLPLVERLELGTRVARFSPEMVVKF
ncbi:MAG: hypothetical protein ACTSW1_19165 [Candidatus Hodarchaeales archaeon]